MNKEQQELLGEAYENYVKEKDKIGLIGMDIRHFLINIARDDKFAKKWGLKIEEVELSLEERIRMYALREGQTYEEFVTNWNTDEQWLEDLSDTTIPTRLITVTYNDKKIESYV
jgi:hypothetical protein